MNVTVDREKPKIILGYERTDGQRAAGAHREADETFNYSPTFFSNHEDPFDCLVCIAWAWSLFSSVSLAFYCIRVALTSNKKLSPGTSLSLAIVMTRLIRCFGPKSGGMGPGIPSSSPCV